MGRWIADRTLYVAADRRTVVPDGDPRARYLLVARGCAIPTPLAAAFGLPGPGAPDPDPAPAPPPVRPPRRSRRP